MRKWQMIIYPQNKNGRDNQPKKDSYFLFKILRFQVVLIFIRVLTEKRNEEND